MTKTEFITRLKSALFLFALFAPTLTAQSFCNVENQTGAAIQAAIDACSAKGGGIAYVPPGEYVTGPLWLKDNVELRLEGGATISLSQNPADWPQGVPALLNSQGAHNIALTGRGTLDGKAQYQYIPMRGVDPEIATEIEIARKAGIDMNRYYRTGVQKYLIVLQNSSEIHIEGVRLINSPLWTLRLQGCDQVWIRGVYLYSDLEKGVNADGIDIVSTSNVLISDSIIITADDSICLKTENFRGGPYQGPVKPTENITVTNSILTSSSTPMVIGTETHADIRHVIFSDIVVRNSNRVFGINVQDGATVSDIRFRNVTFDLNRRHWNWWGSAEVFKFVLKKRTPESKLGRIENISIEGAQGTARGTSLLSGLNNVTLRDVHIRMLPEDVPDKRITEGIIAEHVDGLTLEDVSIENDPATIVLRDVKRLETRNIKAKVTGP